MDHSNESVNGIIFNSDRDAVLLIKRRDVPVWTLPGGGIEKNESPLAATKREIEEETGLKVTVKQKTAEYSPLCRLARFTHVYECQVEGGSLKKTEETADIKFFPLSSLPKRLPPPYTDWIADAKAYDGHMIQKEITTVTYFALFKNLILHPFLVIRFLFTKIGIKFNSK